MRKLFLLALLLLALILLGCSQEVEEKTLPGTAVVGEAPKEEAPKEAVPSPEALPESSPLLGACNASWKCISSSTKAWQLENCSFAQRVECPLGCEDNACRKGSTCIAGFKCKGSQVRGYQTESCAWISETKCEYGCLDAECLPKPNVTASTSIVEEVPVAPPPPKPVLNLGETVEVGGKKLSIHQIESGQVQLAVDGKRSDWLTEGSTYTSGNVVITVHEIFFQSYEGGKKQISYSLS